MQRRRVQSVGMSEFDYFQCFALKIERISVENLWRDQLGRKLARKARFPDGFHKVGLDLVLTGSNHVCRGKSLRIWKFIKQHLQTEEVITMTMSYINGDKIHAALDDPIHKLPRLLRGQERIDQNSVALTKDERDGIGDPSKIFLAGWDALRGATTFFGQ